MTNANTGGTRCLNQQIGSVFCCATLWACHGGRAQNSPSNPVVRADCLNPEEFCENQPNSAVLPQDPPELIQPESSDGYLPIDEKDPVTENLDDAGIFVPGTRIYRISKSTLEKYPRILSCPPTVNPHPRRHPRR